MELVITTTGTSADILTALATGTAHVHSVREDGTTRRRHFLQGKAYQEALWVRLQREGQEEDLEGGFPYVEARSMGSIAKELHISIAALRRILIDLAITEELEAMEQDELDSMLQGGSEDLTTEELLEEAEYGQQ